MRKIDSIIIHCSATKAGRDFCAADIARWHRERGFDDIGYHYVVRLDGAIEKGRDVTLTGAHCKGWNERSIGICYIGGLDENGRPADTRTNAQKRVLYQMIMDLQKEYGILQVMGHRDVAHKDCPCFDVKEFLRTGWQLLFSLAVVVCLAGCGSGKTVVSSSRVETDSAVAMVYNRSLSGQAVVAENVSEAIEERMEQTVFVFPTDTALDAKAGMWVKTIINRKIGKETTLHSEASFIDTDSLRMDSRARMAKDEATQSKSVGKLGYGCIIVFSLFAIFLATYLARRE